MPLANSGEAENFTKYPHLTLDVLSHGIEATLTIPHAVNSTMRRKLVELGENGFQLLMTNVVENLKPLLRRCPGATPRFRGLQRRYPSRRATPLIDARIDFDLRTAVPLSGPPKVQLRWLTAAYTSFVNKKGSNYQIQIGVLFGYDRCPELQHDDALDLVAAAWLACKPVVELVR